MKTTFCDIFCKPLGCDESLNSIFAGKGQFILQNETLQGRYWIRTSDEWRGVRFWFRRVKNAEGRKTNLCCKFVPNNKLTRLLWCSNLNCSNSIVIKKITVYKRELTQTSRGELQPTRDPRGAKGRSPTHSRDRSQLTLTDKLSIFYSAIRKWKLYITF